MNKTHLGASAGSMPREGATGVYVDVLSRLPEEGFNPALLVKHDVLLRDGEEQRFPDAQYAPVLRAAGVRLDTLGKRDDGSSSIPAYTTEDVERAAAFAKQHDVITTLEERPLSLWNEVGDTPPIVAQLYRSGHNKPDHEIHALKEGLQAGRIVVATVDSDASKAAYLERGVPAGNIKVVHNGIDLDKFHPSEKERARVRGELGIEEDAPVVLFIGRFSPEKDVPLLLDSADALFNRGDDVARRAHVILAGTGLTPDNPEMRALITERLGNDPEHLARLHALGPRSDFASMYPASDVLAITSATESRPLCISEAYASGLNVVASTDVGDAASMIGEHGIITSRHPEEIAESWVQAYTNRDAIGYDLANREELGIKPMVRGYSAIIRSALK